MIAKLLVLIGLALTSALSDASPVPAMGTWMQTLHPRDINNDGVADSYYDSDLNITWLDMKLLGLNATSYIPSEGLATIPYLGITGWRYPKIVDTGEPGCDFTEAGGPGTDCGYNVDPLLSELAHMYYVTLGNPGLCTPGISPCVQP